MVSSPPPTKMFPFGGFPLGTPAPLRGGFPSAAGYSPAAGGPIRGSPDQRLRAPTRGLSQLATPFVGARAEPSTGRLSRAGLAGASLVYAAARLYAALTAARPARPGRSALHPGGLASRVASRGISVSSARCLRGLELEGGDPAAGSPTATLLRLLPPRRGQVRPDPYRSRASPGPSSGGATGGVCKEQGRIHRALVTRGY